MQRGQFRLADVIDGHFPEHVHRELPGGTVRLQVAPRDRGGHPGQRQAGAFLQDALEMQRREGLTPLEAIFQGCLVRFRPIMMTTFAALMGTLPIALGIGVGAESRRPLGRAVVGGLLVSQFLTLYITPVIYYYLDRAQTWVMAGCGRQPVLHGPDKG